MKGRVQGFDRGHRGVIAEDVKAFVLSGSKECVVEAIGGEIVPRDPRLPLTTFRIGGELSQPCDQRTVKRWVERGHRGDPRLVTDDPPCLARRVPLLVTGHDHKAIPRFTLIQLAVHT